MFPEILSSIGTLTTVLITVLGAGWAVLWRLLRTFDQMRTHIDDKIDEMKESFIQKLEYHERHDDERFSGLSNNIWELRVANAIIKHSKQPIKSKIEES